MLLALAVVSVIFGAVALALASRCRRATRQALVWLFDELTLRQKLASVCVSQDGLVYEITVRNGADEVSFFTRAKVVARVHGGELIHPHRTLHGFQLLAVRSVWEKTKIATQKQVHFCAGSACPGLPWPASVLPHPITCVGRDSSSTP